jgi:hypothetical protein
VIHVLSLPESPKVRSKSIITNSAKEKNEILPKNENVADIDG